VPHALGHHHLSIARAGLSYLLAAEPDIVAAVFAQCVAEASAPLPAAAAEPAVEELSKWGSALILPEAVCEEAVSAMSPSPFEE